MTETIQSDKPVILVGGGCFAPILLKKYVDMGYLLVAADGGANQLYDIGILPQHIIGDMDSVNTKLFDEQQVSMLHITEQDTTDFEKCLYSIRAPLFVSFGFTGRRFDHSLASFHVLAKWFKTKKIILANTVDFVLTLGGEIALGTSIGDIISIYPQQPVKFQTSEGLKYPLDNLTLEIGDMVGTSNEAIGSRVLIKPEDNNQNPYALILPYKYLDQVIDKALSNEF